MEAYPSRSARGLAAIETAAVHNARAIPVILSLLDAETDDDFHLASELLGLAKRRAIIDVSLARRSLAIIKEDGPVVLLSMRQAIGDPRSGRGREFRVRAAEEYLVWSAQFGAVSVDLEKSLVEAVDKYDTSLLEFEQSKPERGNGNIYVRACIRTLISFNRSMHGRNTPMEKRVSFEVFIALGRVFSHSPDLLDRVNIWHLKSNWETAMKGDPFDP